MEKSKLRPNKCWEWTGNLTKKGYGQTRIKGITFSAHRLSWLLFHGGGLTKLQVLHKCDNRKCINPTHLFLGTNADNLADRQKKGRQVRGERHPRSRFTQNQVLGIRKMVSLGISVQKIADDYGVNNSTIYNMVNRKTWKHI